jgi:uncharacterized RDD family membrane protein YckC
VPLADFGARLAAYVIDVALLGVASIIVAVPAAIVLFRSLPDPDQFAYDDSPRRVLTEFVAPLLLFEAGLFVFILVAYYFYAVEYMHHSGQTLGKKAMKIRVVPIDPRLTLTRGMAAKRYLVEYGGGAVVPFFSYLDGLWQLWDKPYQQTLHDKVARTVVVKVSA